MDAFRQWAAAVCTVAIGCAAIKIPVAKKGAGRLFHGIVAAFFLCALILPIAGMRSVSLPTELWEEDAAPNKAVSTQAQEQLRRQSEQAIMALCERYLKNYNITVKNVTVHTDISPEGSIYLSHVTLRLDKHNAANAWTVRQLMEQQLGVEVEVETS